MKEQLLIIFTKPPVPGVAKTRLISELGAEGAAKLQQLLIERTLSRVVSPELWDTELWVASDQQHPLFLALLESYPLTLHCQRGIDLGVRMLNAIRTGLHGYKRVTIIGTDCPVMEREYVKNSFAELAKIDIAITPAEDGGYVMLSLAQVEPLLFQNVTWGSQLVTEQTLQRIQELQWSYKLLPTLWDVDTASDLARLNASGFR